MSFAWGGDGIALCKEFTRADTLGKRRRLRESRKL